MCTRDAGRPIPTWFPPPEIDGRCQTVMVPYSRDPGQFGDRVREFTAAIAGPLIYKPLSSGILCESDGLHAIYATRIEADDIDDWLDPAAIRLAPHQFQECVTPKAYDLRVTAVGDRLFPVAIHTADPYQLDWRSNYDTLSLSACRPADKRCGRYSPLPLDGGFGLRCVRFRGGSGRHVMVDGVQSQRRMGMADRGHRRSGR